MDPKDIAKLITEDPDVPTASDEGSQTYEDETGLYEINIRKLWIITKNNPIKFVSTKSLYKNLIKRGWQFGEDSEWEARADLNYPIILDETGDLIDGTHRIRKALTIGAKTIKATIATIDQIKEASTWIPKT
jgi:hypothetical protein